MLHWKVQLALLVVMVAALMTSDATGAAAVKFAGKSADVVNGWPRRLPVPLP